MFFNKNKKSCRIICAAVAFFMGISLTFASPTEMTVRADGDQKVETTDTKSTTTNDQDTKGIDGDKIVAKARSYIGKVDYVYGGKDLKTGVDCSGFVCCIYELFGINLWPYRGDGYAWMFYNYRWFGKYIGKDARQAQAGDLIITTDHVAIATGKGTAISALNPGQGVMEHSLLNEWASSYFGGYEEGGGWIIIRPFGVKGSGVAFDPLNGYMDGVDYSAVYNYEYYSKKYKDLRNQFGVVSRAKTEDKKIAIAKKYLEHFIKYGMAEGRQAKADFNVNVYRKNYRDLNNAYGSDLQKYYMHYINYGKNEKRNAKTILKPTTVYNGVDYSDVYDFRYYQKYNQDVKNCYGEDDEATLRHFVVYGMKEGRRAKSTFDLKSYINKYRDLRRAFGNDNVAYYKHYMKYGAKEKRVATGVKTIQNYETFYTGSYGPNIDYSLVYDYNYYVNKYADVRKAFGYDDKAVLEHFVKYGMKEGRVAKATFDINYYKNSASNPDLRRSFGVTNADNYKYYVHYIKYGYKEKRKATK